MVYDHDVEGCDEDETATRPAINGDGEVVVFASRSDEAEINEKKIEQIFEALVSERNS